MKYLVKQVIRAARIVNRHGLVVRNWSPRKVIGLYLGFSNFFAFHYLSSDSTRCYEKNIIEEIFQCVDETHWQNIWEAAMECHNLVGLVSYLLKLYLIK